MRSFEERNGQIHHLVSAYYNAAETLISGLQSAPTRQCQISNANRLLQSIAKRETHLRASFTSLACIT